MTRALSSQERELLLWVLPDDRPVYAHYRRSVVDWVVVSRAERGEGHLLLAPPGAVADLEMPLPQVFAYGVVQTPSGETVVTVRELVANQLDCDISYPGGEAQGGPAREIGRWSYSSWSPGNVCPQCRAPAREVTLHGKEAVVGVLAVCVADRRIWVFDAARAIALPVPLTSFYAELMRIQNVRDPKVALDPDRFFSVANSTSDADLTNAFARYNKLKPKIATKEDLETVAPPRESLLRFMRNLIGKPLR